MKVKALKQEDSVHFHAPHCALFVCKAYDALIEKGDGLQAGFVLHQQFKKIDRMLFDGHGALLISARSNLLC